MRVGVAVACTRNQVIFLRIAPILLRGTAKEAQAQEEEQAEEEVEVEVEGEEAKV